MIVILLGRAAQFLLALVTMRVATTLMSPSEMGKVSLIVTTTGFFALFLINPVGMFINRRLHAWQASGVAKQYLTIYFSYLLLIAILSGLALKICHLNGIVNFGISIFWLVLLICGSLFFNTINQTSIPSINMLGDGKSFVLLTVSTLIISFICAAVFAQNIEPKAQYWLLGILIGQALLSIIGTKILFSKLQNNTQNQLTIIRKNHLRALFKFSWPVAISAGLIWIQGQGYRYIIDAELGTAELGLFAAGYGISAGLIAGFEAVLTTYFQPRLYSKANTSSPILKAQAWHQYSTAIIPSLILTTSLVIILAKELTWLLLGNNFQLAARFVVWGALAETARVLVGIYSLIAHVFMRTNWLIIPSIVGAGLTLLLTTKFIKPLGLEGVGIALTISGFSMVLIMHLFLGNKVGKGISIRAITLAVFFAAALGLIPLNLHNFLTQQNLENNLIIILLTGFSYLGVQYYLLKEIL